MNEKKIAWKRVEGEDVWIGVRGRVKFFTLRLQLHGDGWDNTKIEQYQLPFALTYHMDGAKSENLNRMTLAEAQRHAEIELDNWLAKAGLIEQEPLTPLTHAINSAVAIVEACMEDGLPGPASEYDRRRYGERIALYTTLTTLTELAVVQQRVKDDAEPFLVALEKRREVLYEVMTSLKDMI